MTSTSFETTPEPPPNGTELFFTDTLDALRSTALTPRFATDAPRSIEGRKELIRGAELLRLHGEKKRPEVKELTGHQILLSDILDSPHRFMGLLEPRRSYKTSTLFAKALGRIATRQEYRVSYTMATLGLKVRARFYQDVVKPLEYLYPDKKDRPFKIVKVGGGERIEWLETGSMFQFLAPKGDSFRSDDWHWIIVDEAGQATVDMTKDIMAGAVSTQDNLLSLGAHFTITGTGPTFRDGNMLWEELEKGRAGKAKHAILEYSTDQDLTIQDVDTWKKARPLLIDMHPNVGTINDVDDFEEQYDQLGPADFLREYCGVAERIGRTDFINMGKWATLANSGKLPKPPAHMRIAFSCHLLGRSASIVAAWRDRTGKAHVILLAHEKGTAWVFTKAKELARKYRVPIVYDTGNAASDTEGKKLAKYRSTGTLPKVPLEPQTWAQVSNAATLLLGEIDGGTLVHYDQPELNEAVAVAVKRGTANSKRWTFGVDNEEEQDVTALSAAALALAAFDEARVPGFTGVVSSAA